MKTVWQPNAAELNAAKGSANCCEPQARRGECKSDGGFCDLAMGRRL